jgi:hypothetical protein
LIGRVAQPASTTAINASMRDNERRLGMMDGPPGQWRRPPPSLSHPVRAAARPRSAARHAAGPGDAVPRPPAAAAGIG